MESSRYIWLGSFPGNIVCSNVTFWEYHCICRQLCHHTFLYGVSLKCWVHLTVGLQQKTVQTANRSHRLWQYSACCSRLSCWEGENSTSVLNGNMFEQWPKNSINGGCIVGIIMPSRFVITEVVGMDGKNWLTCFWIDERGSLSWISTFTPSLFTTIILNTHSHTHTQTHTYIYKYAHTHANTYTYIQHIYIIYIYLFIYLLIYLYICTRMHMYGSWSHHPLNPH